MRTSIADSAVVATLAHRCTRIHGEVVYQARAFYTQLYGINEVYNDDSLCALPNTMRRGNPYAVEESTTQDYTLYPNPNNGTFTLTSLREGGTTTTQSDPVIVKVYNALGQQIYQTNSGFIKGSLTLNIGQQAAGVYLVCFGDEKARTVCLRFTIK